MIQRLCRGRASIQRQASSIVLDSTERPWLNRFIPSRSTLPRGFHWGRSRIRRRSSSGLLLSHPRFPALGVRVSGFPFSCSATSYPRNFSHFRRRCQSTIRLTGLTNPGYSVIGISSTRAPAGGAARLPGPSRGDPFARSSLGEGGTVVHAAQPAGPWVRPWPR